MLPLLAPLLGSLAGSLLPATVGTGIAGALGIGGTAAGGLLAAAAPKAIGAGIGTLLAGGDLGDAAVNAIGFGAAGAAMGGAGGASAAGGAPATSLRPVMRPPNLGSAVPSAVSPAATQGAGATAMQNLQRVAQVAPQLMGNAPQQPAMPAVPQRRMNQAPASSSSFFAPPPPVQPVMQAPQAVPIIGGPAPMPSSASVGIGGLGFNNMLQQQQQQQPLFPQGQAMRGFV